MFTGGSGSDAAAGAMFFGIIALYAMIAVGVVIVLVFLPAAFVRMALTGRFAAGFEVREIVSFVGRNLGNYVLAGLLYLVTSVVASFGWLLLCVGIFPAAFWSQCVLGWALGETADDHLSRFTHTWVPVRHQRSPASIDSPSSVMRAFMKSLRFTSAGSTWFARAR